MGSYTALVLVLAVIVTAYGLHRLALWMEARGWIYYRKKRGSSGTLGTAFLEMQTLLEPGKRHVIEIVRKDDSEQNDTGDPPSDQG
jgi:hypothetical protein